MGHYEYGLNLEYGEWAEDYHSNGYGSPYHEYTLVDHP
jgi:hypothetical protein